MKTNQIIGMVFLVNAIILGVIIKIWYIGLPMAIIGLCYLIGIFSDDNE
ncbi:hypothetical protein [Streptococcus halotolerans]|nr:hypothetical protein [Streptococcus halotolerans]